MVSKKLSVCLSVTNFDLNHLRTGEIESRFTYLKDFFWGFKWLEIVKDLVEKYIQYWVLEWTDSRGIQGEIY